jgi:hypothetical protein
MALSNTSTIDQGSWVHDVSPAPESGRKPFLSNSLGKYDRNHLRATTTPAPNDERNQE